jgi:hypothetical protein
MKRLSLAIAYTGLALLSLTIVSYLIFVACDIQMPKYGMEVCGMVGMMLLMLGANSRSEL